MTRTLTLRYCLAAALLAATSTGLAAPASKPVHTLAQAPAGLVAAVTNTVSHEAATNPAYAIGTHGCARLAAPGTGSPFTPVSVATDRALAWAPSTWACA